jgi:hypothetical protein
LIFLLEANTEDSQDFSDGHKANGNHSLPVCGIQFYPFLIGSHQKWRSESRFQDTVLPDHILPLKVSSFLAAQQEEKL